MLHEILLALSGHPSPIFSAETGDSTSDDPVLPLLTDAEKALLRPLGLLATLHRNIRKCSIRISEVHPSTVCRAVSTAVLSSHLSQFQKKILDVERNILMNDASYVGAYGIVPLASIVAEFEDWKRRMSWYWDLVCFILPVESDNLEGACSGANLIDKLRKDMLTGYPDVELCAAELGAVAERAWLRQLLFFLLYGKLPDHAPKDFFVQRKASRGKERARDAMEDIQQDYYLQKELIPSFVSSETASSVLYIGRSLSQLQQTRNLSINQLRAELKPALDPSLLADHVKHISKLRTPISTIDLSEAVRCIRQSISRNIINEVLPIQKTVQTFSYLRKFLLLGREDFAETLIRLSEKHLQSRAAQSHQGSRALAGIVMKEGEVASVLAHTWSELEGFLGIEDTLSNDLEWGREHLHLLIYMPPQISSNSETDAFKSILDRFNDFLLASPTVMTLSLPPHHELFFSKQDFHAYSCMHSYLVSIRRGHVRLTDLWRQNSIRKHSLESGVAMKQRGSKPKAIARQCEDRVKSRTIKMRSTWATANYAVSILSTLGQYLNGEVIEPSWKAFYDYISLSQDISMDPEMLVQAHRKYLRTLASTLLLDNVQYTRILRAFLLHCDQLVGLVSRLQGIWRKLDVHEDNMMVNTITDLQGEEADVEQQLHMTTGQLQGDTQELINCLRIVDDEESIADRVKDVILTDSTDFKPWNSGGTDRLLMRIYRNDLSD